MSSREQRNKMIANIMKRPDGMRLLAKDMTQPLRFFQDYQSVGRSAIMVETLTQGQDPLVDLDITSSVAYMVADLGQDVLTLINPETQRIQTSEIASNPEISYSQLAARKYDVKSRIETYARAEIFRVEDRMIFNALLAAATHKFKRPIFQKNKFGTGPITLGNGDEITLTGSPVNTPVIASADTISIREISAAMAEIEKHGGLKATNLYMNPLNAQILRNINTNGANGFFVDFDTSKELMNTGFIATVYGLNVYVSPEIPTNVLLVTAESELTGRLVERIPLTVIPYEDAKARRTGFSLFEEVGVLIHNPKAVAAIQING